MIYSNNTYDIINGLDTYTRRDFKRVFDKANNKWYMLNNLGQYEEYGIYENVESLEGTTSYNGKLVMLTTNNHEYKWTGTEWIDLGDMINIPIGWVNFNKNAIFISDYNVSIEYPKHNYFKIQHCANVTSGYLYNGSTSGSSSSSSKYWLSFEYSSNKTYGYGYWNYGSLTVKYGNAALSKWQTDTNSWIYIQNNNHAMSIETSSGSSSTLTTFSGSMPNNYVKICTDDETGARATSVGKLYNIKFYTDANTVIYDYYGSYKDGKCCLYDAVNNKYLENQYTGDTMPTFELTGSFIVAPIEYPSLGIPVQTQIFPSNINYQNLTTECLYYMDAQLTKLCYMSKAIYNNTNKY